MRFWLQFNLVLLLIYLGFFHACNVVQWPMILLLGVGFGFAKQKQLQTDAERTGGLFAEARSSCDPSKPQLGCPP